MTTYNLADVLVDRHVDAGHGDRVALHLADRTVTYGELASLVSRSGNAWRELGVRPEERVAIVLPDSLEFVVAFLGLVKIGAVPVTLSTLLTRGDCAYLLSDSRARAVVTTAALAPLFETLRPALRHLARVVVADGAEHRERIARASETLETEPTVEDDPCFWQYSSGTTGRPKGVIHRQRGAAYPAELHGRYVVAIGPNDRSLSVAKLFFSYGLINTLVAPLFNGASSVLLSERPNPALVFAAIERHRPTVFYGVPTSYAALLAYAEAQPRLPDLSSIRVFVSAGEALPAAIFDRWRARFGSELLDGIGSTEIGYIAISNRPGRARGARPARWSPATRCASATTAVTR